MRLICSAIALCAVFSSVAAAQSASTGAAVNSARISAYIKSLPNTDPPVFDATEKLSLAALPLSCEDHPQAAPPPNQSYLWLQDDTPRILMDYDKHRAFYGCFDWHSAVNSMWMLVSLLKEDPKIRLAPQMHDTMDNHLKRANIEGEIEFFTKLKGRGARFEKPYGYAWLLKLYGELKTWDDPDAKKLATAVEPFAKMLSERYVSYLYDLNFPVRTGLHPNTALTMGFVLDYTNLVEDPALEHAVKDTALRFFSDDKNCPTAYEPNNGDFVSPCLTEAATMARVLDQKSYVAWLNSFLPPVDSPAFQVYAKDIDTSHGNSKEENADQQMGAKSHLIGLSFERATQLLTIANALPKDDPRVAAFRKLSTINAKHGYDKIGTAGYMGQHWLATYALLYENALKGPVPRKAGTTPGSTKKEDEKKGE